MILKYKTWGETKVVECEHFMVAEITNLYFQFLWWEIKIPAKMFPRKFYNYWKVHDT